MERRLAIAATGPVSLAAGREVARAGGNAVDVAVAAALAAMSTEPGIASLAGGAFVSVWPADGEPVVIDGNVEMPGRGLPVERFGAGVEEVFTEYAGGVTLHAGHGSVAT
ncbi:MAG TPA: gamma-glutamyltransferase, partial [Ornithinibacter sp.]|nr:gamma-glutamyltransferase [Ornithinibacter sp.]